jgi:hypothetical protein
MLFLSPANSMITIPGSQTPGPVPIRGNISN